MTLIACAQVTRCLHAASMLKAPPYSPCASPRASPSLSWSSGDATTLSDVELTEWASQLFAKGEGEANQQEALVDALDKFLEGQGMDPFWLNDNEHMHMAPGLGQDALEVPVGEMLFASSISRDSSSKAHHERAEKTDEQLRRVDEKLAKIARIECKLPRPCVLCRAEKVFCDKKFPCTRCVERGCECVIPHTVRLGRPRKSDQGKVTDVSQKTAADIQRIAAKNATKAARLAQQSARDAEKKGLRRPRAPVESKFTPEQMNAAVAMSLWCGSTRPPPASSASIILPSTCPPCDSEGTESEGTDSEGHDMAQN